MGLNLVTVVPGSQQRGGVQFGASTMQSLKETDVTAILSDCPAVLAATPEVRGNGQAVFGPLNWPTSLYGENESYLQIRERSVTNGRMFTDREISSAAKVCLLGQTVVTNLFGQGADPVGQVLRFKKIPFLVIGVLDSKGLNTFGQDQDDLILAPYTTVQKRVQAITWVQSIYTSAVDSKSTALAATQIEETLRRTHKIKASDQNDFTIRNQTELLSTFSSVSDILTVLLGAIAGISLLVGGIGIMNIMYVSVTERTREIGLAYGNWRKRIRYIITIPYRIDFAQYYRRCNRYSAGYCSIKNNRFRYVMAYSCIAKFGNPVICSLYRYRNILWLVPCEKGSKSRSD